MKFSTRTEYGLRAIVHLDPAGKKPVSLAMIARDEGLSLSYLERLFARMKKAGIVKSVKGVNGGYLLAAPAGKITTLQIIEALEGTVAPYGCVDKKVCCECGCKVHPVWEALYAQVRKTLNSISLKSIM